LKQSLGRHIVMQKSYSVPVFLAAFMVAFFSFHVLAQDIPKDVKKQSENLDVPFAVSHSNVVKAMLDMAKVTKDDFIIDLGSGDGRIVITAATAYGARGFGVDLNKELVTISNARARRAGVADRVEFFVRDIFETDIDAASVVTMYLFPKVVLQLKPKLLSTLKPGTRVVSHKWHLDDWRPDAMKVTENNDGVESVVYMWIVPAKLGGLWKWEIEYPAYFEGSLRYQGKITQSYQDIEGEVEVRLNPMRIRKANLQGDQIEFSATGVIEHEIVRHDFKGLVRGDRITGTVRLSGSVRELVVPWQAWRASASVP